MVKQGASCVLTPSPRSRLSSLHTQHSAWLTGGPAQSQRGADSFRVSGRGDWAYQIGQGGGFLPARIRPRPRDQSVLQPRPPATRAPPLSSELRGGWAEASCRNGHRGGRGGVPVPSSGELGPPGLGRREVRRSCRQADAQNSLSLPRESTQPVTCRGASSSTAKLAPGAPSAGPELSRRGGEAARPGLGVCLGAPCDPPATAPGGAAPRPPGPSPERRVGVSAAAGRPREAGRSSVRRAPFPVSFPPQKSCRLLWRNLRPRR